MTMFWNNGIALILVILVFAILLACIFVIPPFIRRKNMMRMAHELGLTYHKTTGPFKLFRMFTPEYKAGFGYKVNVIDGTIRGHGAEIYDFYGFVYLPFPFYLFSHENTIFYRRRTKIRIDNVTRELPVFLTLTGFAPVSKIKKYLEENVK